MRQHIRSLGARVDEADPLNTMDRQSGAAWRGGVRALWREAAARATAWSLRKSAAQTMARAAM